MVLSIGAATRNVRGGRFRSRITGFLAQLARKASALPATAMRARERKYLRKAIQISPRSWGRRQVICVRAIGDPLKLASLPTGCQRILWPPGRGFRGQAPTGAA